MKIDEVEAEVFHIILEYVCNTSPKTAGSLMLVNSYFRNAVQVVSNHQHKFVLSCSIEQSMEKQRKLQESTILKNLRHLTVVSHGPWEIYDLASPEGHRQFLERFEPFNTYIRSIRSLATLTWNAGPVPETLLAVLKTFHPRARLKVFDFTRFRPYTEALDESEIALSQFTNLTHFRFSGKRDALSNFAYVAGNVPTYYDYPAFLSITAAAPMLKYAGYVSSARWDARLPARKGLQSRSIESLTLDVNSTLSKPMLTDINAYIDLGEVQSLKFSRGQFEHNFFEYAPTFFTKLRHISMNLNHLHQMDEQSQSSCISSIKKFFLQCHPLQTISLWSWVKALDLGDILPRHGSELRTLQLHEREQISSINEDRSIFPDGTLTLNDLEIIRRSCPNLADLTVDMPSVRHELKIKRNSDLYAKLAEIALFKPSLQVLRIYFGEVSIEDHDTDVLRFVTSIWKRIYGARTTGERRLEVKFGEWEARQWRSAETDRRRFYQIMPHDRDDMSGECQIECHRKK